MAGQPKRRAMIERLERRTAEYFELDPVDVAIGAQQAATTLDYVCEWLGNGKTINELAGELTQELGYTVHREWIGTYLRKAYSEAEADQRLANARSHASHSMAEAAIGIVDQPAETTVDVSRNAARARARQWTAERYNPKDFGSQKGVNVAVSITSLHLAALQATAPIVTSASIQGGEQGQLPSGQPIQVVEPS